MQASEKQRRELRESHDAMQEALRNLVAANIAGATCSEIVSLAHMVSQAARRWARASDDMARIARGL